MARLAITTPIKPFHKIAKRWLLAATFVFGTYNPSGYSYWDWVTQDTTIEPVELLVGIFLFTALLAIGRMALASLGIRGVFAVLALILAGIIAQLGLGWMRFADLIVTRMTLLFWITTVLGIGLSWSLIQKNLTGERDIVRRPP